MKSNFLHISLFAISIILISLQMNREIALSWWLIFGPVIISLIVHVAKHIFKDEIYTEDCSACEAECDIEDMACVEGEFFCYDCWLELSPGILAKKQSAGEID